MFSQKKSFFKGKLFYIILVGLFAFGYWINQSPIIDNPDNVNTDSKIPVNSEDKAGDSGNQKSNDILDNIIGGSNYKTTENIDDIQTVENSGEEISKGYYLIKEVDGLIKIFYYDNQGKENLIRTTDIAFSLLSVTDQALFQKGVIKHTEEELDELLQDFES